MISRVLASSCDCRPAASGCISSLSDRQTASSCEGFVASTRHRFGTKSMPLVCLMSANISATRPVASASATGRTVAIRDSDMLCSFAWLSVLLVDLQLSAAAALEQIEQVPERRQQQERADRSRSDQKPQNVIGGLSAFDGYRGRNEVGILCRGPTPDHR